MPFHPCFQFLKNRREVVYHFCCLVFHSRGNFIILCSFKKLNFDKFIKSSRECVR